MYFDILRLPEDKIDSTDLHEIVMSTINMFNSSFMYHTSNMYIIFNMNHNNDRSCLLRTAWS